jgi:hypothetical protein
VQVADFALPGDEFPVAGENFFAILGVHQLARRESQKLIGGVAQHGEACGRDVARPVAEPGQHDDVGSVLGQEPVTALALATGFLGVATRGDVSVGPDHAAARERDRPDFDDGPVWTNALVGQALGEKRAVLDPRLKIGVRARILAPVGLEAADLAIARAGRH